MDGARAAEDGGTVACFDERVAGGNDELGWIVADVNGRDDIGFDSGVDVGSTEAVLADDAPGVDGATTLGMNAE